MGKKKDSSKKVDVKTEEIAEAVPKSKAKKVGSKEAPADGSCPRSGDRQGVENGKEASGDESCILNR